MKLIALLLAILTPFLTFITTDPFVKLDKEIPAVEEKLDGFMKGVCHAEPDYELLNEGNIEWFRDDIPFPYDKDGNLSASYISWKKEAAEYAANGVKIFGITPYPEDFMEYGLDPRDPASKEAIQDIARFYVTDLKGIVGAFQVTNEMGIDRFTLPLTLEEAADFIGMQLEAMYPLCEDIALGYNLGGLSIVTLPFLMMPYHKYCDYVGVDMYLGCFEPVLKKPEQMVTILNFVRVVTQKPIILCEFGYIGLGEPKSDEEKNAILQQYGYNSEAEARADINGFINNLPKDMKEEIIENYSDRSDAEKGDLIFDGEYSNHLYCELQEGFGLYDYEHTPEGQAEFFAYIIPKLRDLDYLVGMCVYCWQDSGDCYVCGQVECPVETKWGLVDYNGDPKPSYYAVQEAYKD